jgi:hypothetical protein
MLACEVVSANALLDEPLPNNPRANCGDDVPASCANAQPALVGSGYFDISAPMVLEPILNQPETENESVRSKLKVDELARLAYESP